MSRLDLEELRARVLAEGGRIGWAALGNAIGRDGEGLRVFAKTAGRSLQPDTLQALQWYFSPPQVSDDVASAIRIALQKSREATDALEVLARVVNSRYDDSGEPEGVTYPTARDDALRIRKVAEDAEARGAAETTAKHRPKKPA